MLRGEVVAKPEGALRATLGCWSLRDFPALLASGGVWLNSAAPQTTPALIRPPLRCSAASKGGAQCALRRGGGSICSPLLICRNCLSHDWCNRLLGYSVFSAVFRL